MKDIQQIFNELEQSKKEQKAIKSMYRDALASHGDYQKVVDEYDVMKAKKKEIEGSVKFDMGKELDKLEKLQQNIKATKDLLSDIAITNLMQGKKIEIKDEFDNMYEPQYSVKFKKTGIIAKDKSETINIEKNTWED
jgi:hypothetical protein